MDQGTGKNIEPFLASLTRLKAFSRFAGQRLDLLVRGNELARAYTYTYIEERYTRCSMYNRAIILAGTSSARIVVVEEENLWSSYARSLTIHARTAYSPRSAVMNWKLHVVQKKNENYLAARRI